MTNSNVRFDFSQYEAFFKRLRKMGGGDFKRDLSLFLEGLGYEFLRILQDEIIQRNVMDTRLLLNSFHKGEKENIWKLSDGGLTLEVGTNLAYSEYVNDGHWTNKKGVNVRFVPGYWKDDQFYYVKGAKTGMVLKQQWIEGTHYWEASVRIMEKIMPELLEKKLDQWLKKYFAEFLR